jgi:D-glycero-alpha-D-manno-heptose-7-phosphate kinase
MIISKAPVRISLGGGGTDLASYYSKFGGFLIAGGIDKYIFICINRRFERSIKLSYSKTEVVQSVDQIEHNIFREALRLCGVENQVELASVADVPANCGLGSSSSFTVALLTALRSYTRDFASLRDLAEEACRIEIDILGAPIGKQDQYMAAFGGVTALTFEPDGQVRVEPLRMPNGKLVELEYNIALFYTGVERNASDILSSQNQKTLEEDQAVIERLHGIKKIGLETRRLFEKGDIDSFGDLLHEHWTTKKKLSKAISSPFMDECYEEARKAGALGGKIMGAGGGGFFMFYCPGTKAQVVQRLTSLGLRYFPFRFDYEGAKIVANLRK